MALATCLQEYSLTTLYYDFEYLVRIVGVFLFDVFQYQTDNFCHSLLELARGSSLSECIWKFFASPDVKPCFVSFDQDVKFPFEVRQLVILGKYSLYKIHGFETKLNHIATVRIL